MYVFFKQISCLICQKGVVYLFFLGNMQQKWNTRKIIEKRNLENIFETANIEKKKQIDIWNIDYQCKDRLKDNREPYLKTIEHTSRRAYSPEVLALPSAAHVFIGLSWQNLANCNPVHDHLYYRKNFANFAHALHNLWDRGS